MYIIIVHIYKPTGLHILGGRQERLATVRSNSKFVNVCICLSMGLFSDGMPTTLIQHTYCAVLIETTHTRVTGRVIIVYM